MSKKMMTLTFVELYAVHIENQDNYFSILVNLFKERYISSVKSSKYLKKLIS